MTFSIKHVAIIMDGNGRWANKRGRSRIWGHIRGTSIVSQIVETASEINSIKSLTLYAFSTENWTRPFSEVSTLFILLNKYLKKESNRILSNRIRFKIIGDLSKLPERTRKLANNLEFESSKIENPKLNLCFAFDYGSRSEIVSSVNSFIKENPGKEISEEDIGNRLYTSGYLESDNIDLLIRTGGEQRISNFLLWQLTYAELYFTSTYWPDFTSKEFIHIYKEVSSRERRFGGVLANLEFEKKSSIVSDENDLKNDNVNVKQAFKMAKVLRDERQLM